jgi:hypothetical protein
LSTAEHVAIDSTVVRTAAIPAVRTRPHVLARPCNLAGRTLMVGGWGVAAAATLPPLGHGGEFAPLCVTVTVLVIAGLAARTANVARASAALAAFAAALCIVAAPGDAPLLLPGLAATLAGSALAVPAARFARAG